MIERFFRPLDNLQRIETAIGEGFDALDIRPAEAAPALWEPIVDAASLHVQAAAKKIGIRLPNVRFRIFTNIETDSIHGSHFGTLEGAIKKAERILQKRG